MSALNIINLPHFWIIIVGIVFLTLSTIIVTIHKPEKWFFLHKIFAITGILLTIIGIFILTGLYNALIHQILGIIAIIWLIGEIIGGFVAYKKKIPQMRKIHILTGRLALLMVIFVMIMGILTVALTSI